MTEHKKRRSASVIYSHLSHEERMDKICELLAIGVMRLAQKERLSKQNKTSEISNEKMNKTETLPKSDFSKQEVKEKESNE